MNKADVERMKKVLWVRCVVCSKLMRSLGYYYAQFVDVSGKEIHRVELCKSCACLPDERWSKITQEIKESVGCDSK